MTAIAQITAFTHRGRVRAGNEDTIVVGGWLSPPEMTEPDSFRHELPAPLVCAVADGMGGHRAGEVASRQAAQLLSTAGAQLASAADIARTLARINGALYDAMAREPAQAGMGTTVVGLALGAQLGWFNVGDSRLYRLDGGALAQLSVDDTPPGPRTGLLTQSLGGLLPPAPVHPHIGEAPLAPPARFLLCSDGLTDMVDDSDIADGLALGDVEAVMQLFDLAMRAGGSDNVSIVVVRLEED
jgi:serine/threonine protein phosphatase PrpC